MTTTTNITTNSPGIASRLVNGLLAIKPLADLAKHQAREMMIKRAGIIGVSWRENVEQLRQHNWEQEFSEVTNPDVQYPSYYLCSFHAYEKGNLDWEPALEVESAAYAVHSTIFGLPPQKEGDARLRSTYHEIMQQQIPQPPQNILDIGCSVGMSTFALKNIYPDAHITGLDLSPYYLAVAKYRSDESESKVDWLHSTAEDTGLPDASLELVSACLLFHELPQKAAKAIFKEAYRILRPGGHFTIMDMNPRSQVYKKMPPYVLTLLKSTEPYLDEYFTLDIAQAMVEARFNPPTITPNTSRHRVVVAMKS